MDLGKGVNSVVIQVEGSVLEFELCIVLVPAWGIKVPNWPVSGECEKGLFSRCPIALSMLEAGECGKTCILGAQLSFQV